MTSILEIEASRANGAKSRGPVTIAGRLAALANSAKCAGTVTQAGQARSAQNPIRHGILAESVVLDGESIKWFTEVLSTLQHEFLPVSAIELRYVETMPSAEWRRPAIETHRQDVAIRYTGHAFRAISDESRYDRRKARRGNHRFARPGNFHIASVHVLARQPHEPKGRSRRFTRNASNENAERSEPNLG